MRNTSYDQDRVRQMGASITVRPGNRVFENHNVMNEDAIIFHDCDTYNDKIYRAASIVDEDQRRYLWTHGYDNVRIPLWSKNQYELMPASSIGVYGNRVFFHANDGGSGKLMYADMYQSAISYVFYVPDNSATLVPGIAPYNLATAIAPVSDHEFYYRTSDSFNGGSLRYGAIGFYDMDTQTDTMWEGAIYSDDQFLSCFDAVRLNGVDYIFFSDNNSRRAVYMTRTGNVWSDVKPVLSMDVVDDIGLFMLGGATVLNGSIYVSGLLKRDEAASMHIYTKGPEHWSLGRSMYIRQGTPSKIGIVVGSEPMIITQPPGKLVPLGDNVWYVAPNIADRAPLDAEMGGTNVEYQTAEIIQGQVVCKPDEPYRMNLDVSSVLSSQKLNGRNLLRPGNEVELTVSLNGNETVIGKFDIDAVAKEKNASGEKYKVAASGKAMKKLVQWTPDDLYEYWSQTKRSAEGKSLGELLRASGTWNDAGTMYLQSLNDDGYLYVVDKTSRNGVIRGKFKWISDVGNPKFGVVVNYYKTDNGHQGVAVVWGPTEHYGDPGVKIYLIRNSVFIPIAASWALDIPTDTYYWLQAEHYEGMIRIHYRVDGNQTWHELGHYHFFQVDDDPWVKSDFTGRGGIYVRNITPYSVSYEFDSGDMYVSVDDLSPFPSTGILLVDDEQMVYSGKSYDITQYGMTYTLGDSVSEYGGTNQEVIFGIEEYGGAYIQEFKIMGEETTTVNGAEVYLRKVGNPTDAVRVGIYIGPADNNYGMCLASIIIDASEIGTTRAIIRKAFDMYVTLMQDSTYWFVFSRTGPIDNNNYYVTTMDTVGDYEQSWKYKVATGEWWPYSKGLYYRLLGYHADNIRIRCIGFVEPDYTVPELNSLLAGTVLRIEEGHGAGMTYRVKGYLGDGLFEVDKSLSIFADDTRIAIYPALNLTSRGHNNTVQTSHSLSQANQYTDGKVYVDRVEYFSSEQDLSLENMIAEIAGKAGVVAVSDQRRSEQLWPESNWTYETTYTLKNNAIVRFRTDWELNGVGLKYRWIDNSYGEIRVFNNAIDILHDETVVSHYLWPYTIQGWVTISIWKKFVSVWCAGRHVFSWYDASISDTGRIYVGCTGDDAVPIDIDWSWQDSRVDNFILDMERSGIQLIGELVTERRVMFQDDEYGQLRAYRRKTTVPGKAYELAIGMTDNDIDAQMITRLRVVGTEIVEVADRVGINQYGNAFAMSYARILEDRSEILTEAALRILDNRAASRTAMFSGSLDPRLEPMDIINVLLPAGLNTPAGAKEIVISEMTISFGTSDDGAVMDMDIQGYPKQAEEEQTESGNFSWLLTDSGGDEQVIIVDPGGGITTYDFDEDGLIQAFIDLPSGGTIYLPEGEVEFQLNGSCLKYLTAKPNVRIYGAGKDKTTLKNVTMMLYNGVLAKDFAIANEVCVADGACFGGNAVDGIVPNLWNTGFVETLTLDNLSVVVKNTCGGEARAIATLANGQSVCGDYPCKMVYLNNCEFSGTSTYTGTDIRRGGFGIATRLTTAGAWVGEGFIMNGGSIYGSTKFAFKSGGADEQPKFLWMNQTTNKGVL